MVVACSICSSGLSVRFVFPFAKHEWFEPVCWQIFKWGLLFFSGTPEQDLGFSKSFVFQLESQARGLQVIVMLVGEGMKLHANRQEKGQLWWGPKKYCRWGEQGTPICFLRTLAQFTRYFVGCSRFTFIASCIHANFRGMLEASRCIWL